MQGFLLVLILIAFAIDCSPRVSVKYDIHRNLPIIVDNSRPGKSFQAGVFHDFSSGDTLRTIDFYDVNINQTFQAWNRSNTLLYFSYSPGGSFALFGGVDDVGPSLELICRPKKTDPRLAFSAAGWKSEKELYFRGTASGSYRPFDKKSSDNGDGLSGLGFFGNLSWTQYPVSIEFDQTYYDTLGVELSWRLAGEEKGSAILAGAGIEADMGWIKAQMGISHAFAMKESGVRVDLGSQPAYLTDVKPSPVTRVLAGVMVEF
jgi:hypothetical protein